MTRHLHRLLPLLFIALSACTTGLEFDRAGMQDALHQRLALAGERETRSQTESPPPFAGPFRLGVYFVQTEFPTRQSMQSVEWRGADKDGLVQRLSPLRDDRIVREVVILAEPTVRTLTRQELRQASVRYGIDVLLLVAGVGAVDRQNNAYALLYPTLIGAYLAPGTVIDALCMLDGVLWDLRTDTMLDRQTAEGQAQRTGAVVMVDDTDVLREAKHRAIEAFGARLVEHLRSLRHEQSGAPTSPQ